MADGQVLLVEPDRPQQLEHLGAAAGSRPAGQTLTDDARDGVARIERAEGVLRDGLDAPPQRTAGGRLAQRSSVRRAP